MNVHVHHDDFFREDQLPLVASSHFINSLFNINFAPIIVRVLNL